MAYLRVLFLVPFLCFASTAQADDTFLRSFSLSEVKATGGVCRVNVSEQSTICQVKKEIQKFCKIAANQQKLAFTYSDTISQVQVEVSIELKNGTTLGYYAGLLKDKGFDLKTSNIVIRKQEPFLQSSCK